MTICDVLLPTGLWCADRAALVLMIKIDKLKTREKYERHFLLLSVLFTAMIKIRKVWVVSFGCKATYFTILKSLKTESSIFIKVSRLISFEKKQFVFSS